MKHHQGLGVNLQVILTTDCLAPESNWSVRATEMTFC